ncbi:peptidase family M49 [Cooperia oncophora]
MSCAAEIDRSLHILPNESPVCVLDCVDAFNALTKKEKEYAHHLSKASYDGGLAVFLQVSPESAGLFVTFYRMFRAESIEELKEKALQCGFTEEEWDGFLVYVAGFYFNNGNYRGFGDTKIVPAVDVAKIDALVQLSLAQETSPSFISTWEKVKPLITSLEESQLRLGFGNEGVTCYHSENVTREDATKVDRYFKARNIESWNSRLFKDPETKDGKTVYRVKLASSKTDGATEEEFEDSIVVTERGDYSPLMARACASLKKAIDSAANENQKKMISKYVEHFTEGDIKSHKDGSRFWIKDVDPVIESYIGFIENYRDPAGTRSEFEGFVACVNKETSKKFKTLVGRAEEILTRLPWGKAYEKDHFLKPDFTALDVLAFASSGIPSGINIPNYDDIRQNEGFKNVSLGNVIAATPKQKMNFIDQEDEDLMHEYHKDSFEVQVGLHELLGHGSGKLFQRNADGTFNFDKDTKDLITGKPIAKWYEPGETWSSKFGVLSGAYEECRAEAVGYVLSCDADILEIFGYTGEKAELVKYVNWLNEIRAGLLALEFYSTEAQKWGQAHCYARFVLTKVCLEAGQDFVTITECVGEDGKPDLKFKLDRTKIDSVGRPAVTAFLAKLQAYKSTGDLEGGRELFESYGKVTDREVRWRDICIARRKPRRIFVQANTEIDDKGDVNLISYDATATGVIQSFVDRYDAEAIDDLEECWNRDSVWYPRTYGAN